MSRGKAPPFKRRAKDTLEVAREKGFPYVRIAPDGTVHFSQDLTEVPLVNADSSNDLTRNPRNEATPAHENPKKSVS
jgi:hypothetical protein